MKFLYSRSESNRNRKNIVKSYLVPCFIVFTFVLMYGVPWLTIEFYAKHQSQRTNNVTMNQSDQDNFANKQQEPEHTNVLTFVMSTIMAAGYVIDPVAYIFLAKRYRGVLSKCCSRRVYHETSVSTTPTTSVAQYTTHVTTNTQAAAHVTTTV